MTRIIHRLRAMAGRLCTPTAVERWIEPALADWRNEYLDAIRHGRHWKGRWIQLAGVLAVLKVVALATLARGAHTVMHQDSETRAARLTAGAIFVVVVAITTVVLAWLPLNTMPVGQPIDAQDLMYLIPQALPIAIPLGVTAAIVLALAGRVSGRLAAWALAWAVTCSVVSFLTLAWWAPSSNQAFRTKIAGFELAKGDNELTLGELATRIAAIRAFDPAAPARRLSVLYHTRWALSCAPLVLALFALAVSRGFRRRSVTLGSIAVSACGAFAFLVILASHLAFRGVVTPSLAAWLPNVIFLGVATAVMLRPLGRTSHEFS